MKIGSLNTKVPIFGSLRNILYGISIACEWLGLNPLQIYMAAMGVTAHQ